MTDNAWVYVKSRDLRRLLARREGSRAAVDVRGVGRSAASRVCARVGGVEGGGGGGAGVPRGAEAPPGWGCIPGVCARVGSAGGRVGTRAAIGCRALGGWIA